MNLKEDKLQRLLDIYAEARAKQGRLILGKREDGGYDTREW